MANPTLLDMPIARDGNKNAIPTTDNGTTGLLSQQYGWQLINAIPPQQGGKAVKREDFNGALYLLSNLLFYLQKGWQFEWDSSQAYYAGCVVKDTDGGLYCANTDVSASSTHPKDDAVNWSRYNSYALRSHSYNVGGTSSLPNIPAGYFLECSTAGTTGASAPVITPPVAEGNTIPDGTVVWTVRRAVCEADYPKTSFGTAVVNHLLGSTLASLVSTVSTDSLFTKLLKKALEAAGLQYNMGTNGYICLGSLFGGLILQWGRAIANTNNNSIGLPIAFKNSYSATVIPAMGGSYDPGVYRLQGVARLNILDFYVSKATSISGGVQCIWIAVGY